MKTSPTLTTHSLQWGAPPESTQPELHHLVLAWSRDEPHRLGEIAIIEEKQVLGRGERVSIDPGPRVAFHRQRPTGAVPMAPLSSPRVSRTQIEIVPTPEGLSLTNVGRCALLINGEIVSSGTARPGDTIALQNALILFVVRRTRGGAPVRVSRATLMFDFGRADPSGVVGESPAAWELRGNLAFAADAPGHVLIHGESGTGKELAARAIHDLSGRNGGKFVARNAATLPEGLVDAELFGSAKNYPNAGSPERAGLIGEADGGTLFLDEIGELAPHVQAHLLRVLDQGGEYQRLGESRTRRSDIRLIAATNRSIDALKHDFAARFAIRVSVPSLSQRREDIPLLFRHLLLTAARSSPSLVERFFDKRGGEVTEPRVAPAIVEALLRRTYTHHLRELERLMWIAIGKSTENFLALTPELAAEIEKQGTAAPPAEGEPEGRDDEQGAEQAGGPKSISRAEVEAALAATNGSVTEAARRLGLKNRFTLYRLLKRYGITTPSDNSSPT